MPNVDIGLVQVLCEYLEAFVHTVLFQRGLYAADLFGRQRLYGIAVRKARHPQLTTYIAQVVHSLKVGPELQVADDGALTVQDHTACAFVPPSAESPRALTSVGRHSSSCS